MPLTVNAVTHLVVVTVLVGHAEVPVESSGSKVELDVRALGEEEVLTYVVEFRLVEEWKTRNIRQIFLILVGEMLSDCVSIFLVEDRGSIILSAITRSHFR